MSQYTIPLKKTLLLACLVLAVTGVWCPLPALAQYKVTHLGHPHNTPGSETAALRVGDTVLAFASLPPSSGGRGAFGVKHQTTHLYQSRIARNGKLSRPKHDRWGFCNDKDHTGNLALDPQTHDAYFTRGDVETLRCDIWYARKKKRGWEKPVKLRGPVNHPQYTATHPSIGRLEDGTTILYFVSNRPGGQGGMDIWQCIVNNGTASEPSNLGPQVNSTANEYTPFYDQTNSTLYFSSDRPGGKGGFDIYCAVGSRNTWQLAESVCGCLNSEENDLYFNISDYDPENGMPIGGYMSSNRKDSYFLSDSMCCNDIYRWSLDSVWLASLPKPRVDTIDTIIATPPKSSPFEHFFPLHLYFHNDEPDPRSTNAVTTANYADCQLQFALMRSEYMAHQRTATDSAAMQLFFDSCVIGNFDKVNELLSHVEKALNEGKRVVLTVSGYASPVFRDDYNHILSQRRTGSFINMLRAWRDGTLATALAEGRLQVEQLAMGAVEASTLKTTDDPVYSVSAARARRIEIRSCNIF